MTTEGSDSLEDLKSLEAQGVEIMTCGTCLDYYGLKDKLAVGTVTNMYSIVETMAKQEESSDHHKLVTYLDKSRIPEVRYRGSGFLVLRRMYNEYKRVCMTVHRLYCL